MVLTYLRLTPRVRFWKCIIKFEILLIDLNKIQLWIVLSPIESHLDMFPALFDLNGVLIMNLISPFKIEFH